MVRDRTQAAIEADPLRAAFTHGLALLAVIAPVWVLVGAARSHRFALDFHYAYLPAARAVVHGLSPYTTSYTVNVIGRDPFVYPPLSAYLLAPFTVLSPVAAEILMAVLVAAAVPATLWLLGVRDWRCYAIAFLWWPTIISIQSANVTLPMLLGLALVWRYRDRQLVAALVTGFLVALKLFFFPLLIWLVATRRYRTAALGAAASVLLIFAPWAGIGFAGLRAYPHLLTSLSRIDGARSYSIAALLHLALPLSWTAAAAVQVILGVSVVLVMFAAGRRGRDRDAMALTAVAILLLTPLLEMQYFATLLVVVGLYHRRFGLAWLAPLLIWGASANGPAGSVLLLVYVSVAMAVAIVLAMSDWRPRVLTRMLQSGSA